MFEVISNNPYAGMETAKLLTANYIIDQNVLKKQLVGVLLP